MCLLQYILFYSVYLILLYLHLYGANKAYSILYFSTNLFTAWQSQKHSGEGSFVMNVNIGGLQ